MTPDSTDESLDHSASVKKLNGSPESTTSPENGKIIKSSLETAIEEYNTERNKPLYLREDIYWRNVIAIATIHMIAIYGYLNYPFLSKKKLWLWTSVYAFFTGFGVTASAHRYWTHRSYKVNLPLKIFLILGFLAAGQNALVTWVRDHRVHHKYSETDADPHNIKRGFFFAHVGWLMMKKHPEVRKNGKKIDVSDIANDPIVAVTEKYYYTFAMMLTFIIPIFVPVILWNEDIVWSAIACICRYVYVLNATWCVNSFAHWSGTKPYNKAIAPTENVFVGFVALGEGWHNYHHMFPFDYRTSEFGGGRNNLTTRFIDFCAKMGWAYDLKEPSQSLVRATIAKRGDGTHELAVELARDEKIVESLKDDVIDSYVKSY